MKENVSHLTFWIVLLLRSRTVRHQRSNKMRIFEFASLNRNVGVMTPEDLMGTVPGKVRSSTAWAKSGGQLTQHLSVVCVLARQCLYPRRQNTAWGPKHHSQPSENPPPSPGPGNLTDSPDPDLLSFPLPTNTSTREEVEVSNYHIVIYYRVVSFRPVGVNSMGNVNTSKISIYYYHPKYM